MQRTADVGKEHKRMGGGQDICNEYCAVWEFIGDRLSYFLKCQIVILLANPERFSSFHRSITYHFHPQDTGNRAIRL